MQLHCNEDISWLTFDHLSECPIRHGIFLRHGGVSSGEFGSLNFGISQGDVAKNAELNRLKALDCLSLSTVSRLYQMHGSNILEARPNAIHQGDGLMTDQPELGIITLHADCQVAIFYDYENHALANVHCGWRGNVQNIYQKTIDALKHRFGSRAENLLVGISPSLGPSAAEFIHYREEFPPFFWEFQTSSNYFDLWEIARQQLLASGILDHHIEIAKICTYSNPDDFFSYRRKKKSGRHGAVAALKKRV